jgi:predicted secreted Zn-dependent protease
MLALMAALTTGCVIGGPARDTSPGSGPLFSAGPPGASSPAPSGATLPSRSTSDEVDLVVRHAFYEVAGRNPKELRAEMDKLGPLDSKGVRRDAYTGWSVTWRYGYDRSRGCSTGPVRVKVEVMYTMPRWSMPVDVDPQLHQRWTRYMLNLRRHEDGHRDIGVHAGEEVRRRMEAMSPRADCGELEREADAVGQEVVAKYRAIEKAYDRDTDHGATQGARFR